MKKILKQFPVWMIQRPDIFFFYCYLLTLPFSIRKILWFLPLRGVFNEYADVSLFLSDICLLLCLSSFIFVLQRNYESLSMVFVSLRSKKRLSDVIFLFSPAALVMWSFITTVYSMNFYISGYSSWRILEFVLLYYYILFQFVSRGTCITVFREYFIKKSFEIIIFGSLLHSMLGVLQFISKASMGMHFFGESIINISAPGVAKIVINGITYIRSYGMFPHPNIFASYLVMCLILTLLYNRVYVEQNDESKSVGTLFLRIVIIMQALALFLTFSKSAWAGLLFAAAYLRYVSRETLNKDHLGRIWSGGFYKICIIGMFLSIVMFLLYAIDYENIIKKSSNERGVYVDIALSIIRNNPILGISCGQMVIFMQDSVIYPLYDWQLQPVHNVFLLIWVELGLIGFMIFTSLVFSAIFQKIKYCDTYAIFSQYYKAILIAFVPMLLLDHYLWDIQQGIGEFWLILSLFVSSVVSNMKK